MLLESQSLVASLQHQCLRLAAVVLEAATLLPAGSGLNKNDREGQAKTRPYSETELAAKKSFYFGLNTNAV
jgi:hypothetical protein